MYGRLHELSNLHVIINSKGVLEKCIRQVPFINKVRCHTQPSIHRHFSYVAASTLLAASGLRYAGSAFFFFFFAPKQSPLCYYSENWFGGISIHSVVLILLMLIYTTANILFFDAGNEIRMCSSIFYRKNVVFYFDRKRLVNSHCHK